MYEELLSMITYYSFEFAFVAMLGGVLYFSLERNSLALEYRTVATLAAVIALVAAVNYYTMTNVVQQSLQNNEGFSDFPTSYRYIDWLITTPMLLAMIVSLLGMKQGLGGILGGLITADIIMIVAGYLGEVNVNMADGSMAMAWGGFIVAMFCWLYILFVLYSVLSSYAAQQPQSIRNALNTLRLFILIGWSIYPIGYFVSLLGASEGVLIAREIIYCYADVISKVIYGMIAVQAAKTASIVWVDGEEQ
jgi:bacteriorhodopsin